MKPQTQTIHEALAHTTRRAQIYKTGGCWNLTLPRYGTTRTHPFPTWQQAIHHAHKWATHPDLPIIGTTL